MLRNEDQVHVHEDRGDREPSGSSGNVAAAVAAAGGDQVEAVAAEAEADDDDFCIPCNDATAGPVGEGGKTVAVVADRNQDREAL